MKKANCKTILLIQTETGLYSKYKISTTSFDINKLEFKIQNESIISESKLLLSVNYDNKKLNSKIGDTLVRSNKVIVLE